MAAIEQFESRGLSETFGGDTLYRNFIVDSSGDPTVAVLDPGLPNRGDAYGDLIVVNIDVYRYTVDTCWAVVTYAETMREEELDMGTEQMRITVDLNGDLIGPWDVAEPPGAMVDRPRARLVIHRWELGGVSEAALLAMLGTLNDNDWRGWPKKFWKFIAVPIRYTPPNLYRITYVFELMPVAEAPEIDGWGPGWQWTWYSRNAATKNIIGSAHTVDVYSLSDFGALGLGL